MARRAFNGQRSPEDLDSIGEATQPRSSPAIGTADPVVLELDHEAAGF